MQVVSVLKRACLRHGKAAARHAPTSPKVPKVPKVPEYQKRSKIYKISNIDKLYKDLALDTLALSPADMLSCCCLIKGRSICPAAALDNFHCAHCPMPPASFPMPPASLSYAFCIIILCFLYRDPMLSAL